jgi:drug/metabolite transporter (DMT)-like permease
MVAVESTTIKYVQTTQKENIPSEQLVFLVEVFKLLASVIMYYYGANRTNSTFRKPLLASLPDDENDDNEGTITEADPLERPGTSSTIWFILPSFLYAVSNNVTFAALMLMSPALFNLLMNLKIPLTGFMACSLLNYKLTLNLGISFVFLFVGSIFATLKWADGRVDVEGSIYGLILMFVYALCSAGAAVYTEYVTRSRYPHESIHLQNIKFCGCSVMANVVIIMIRGVVPFTTFHPIHLASVVALGANGLVTSAVLKYAGSIVKTYAVSCAAFVSALFTWFLFKQTLQWNFYVGAVVCALAIRLYIHEKEG